MKKVLWLLDSPYWAYEARSTSLIKRLTNYDHSRLYVVDNKIKRNVVNEFSKRFDLVVCMYSRYVEMLDRTDNVIVLHGGFRALENEEQKKERAKLCSQS